MESLDVDISTLAEDLQSKSKRGLGEKDSDDQETSYIIPEIAEEEEYVNIKRENLLKGDQVEQFLFYEKNTGDIKTEGSGDDSTEDQMKSDQDNEKQRRSRLANKRQKNG